MTPEPFEVDVLCVGHACYDLVFSVSLHPAEDEKIIANSFMGSGGGPAANAAIAASLLGCTSAFTGYLGQDFYGKIHFQEFIDKEVNTNFIVRGPSPTPLSTVIVKPDGKRALINYKGKTKALSKGSIDFSSIKPKVILLDGHEPHISLPLVERARIESIPTILDAGSLHEGTSALMDKVEYLACSEKFARQFAGDEESALTRLADVAPNVVITLGERGLTWQREEQHGSLPAFQINAIDTTGAGDAFHGAFAVAVASNMDWKQILRYASAAGALCCTKMGARQGLPAALEISTLLEECIVKP